MLKFGGAAVRTPESFRSIAEIIKLRKACYDRIVVAISAMGDTTDELILLAKRVHPAPPKRELDMLLSVGERISMSLLAMSLDTLGISAASFTGSQSGILTTEDHTQAKIVDLKPKRVLAALEAGKVSIVAGFQGMSLTGEITTLGRGGTDTTAVALAIALGAKRVEFYKDVDGIFDRDPHVHQEAQLLEKLSYSRALNIIEKGAQVLHDRCVTLAAKHKVCLHVLPFSSFASSALVPDFGSRVEGDVEGTDQKHTLHSSSQVSALAYEV